VCVLQGLVSVGLPFLAFWGSGLLLWLCEGGVLLVLVGALDQGCR
jgi:hypothetical protein